MKKSILTLLVLISTALGAKAMSYEQARDQALFLTDKMAYELNLTDEQYDAAYEINLDYLLGVNTVDDVYATCWEQRNYDMQVVLYDWQWDAFCAASYFFRPLYWGGGVWHFGIYAHYPHRDFFYFDRPTVYISYRGGHSWRFNGGRSWYHDHPGAFRPGHGARGMRDMRGGRRWRDGGPRGDRGGFGGSHSSGSTTSRGNQMGNSSSTSRGGSFGGSHSSSSTTSQGSNMSRSSNMSRNSNMSRSSNMRGMRQSSTRSTVSNSSSGFSGSSRSSSGFSGSSRSSSFSGGSHSGGSFSGSSHSGGGFSGGSHSGGGGSHGGGGGGGFGGSHGGGGGGHR